MQSFLGRGGKDFSCDFLLYKSVCIKYDGCLCLFSRWDVIALRYSKKEFENSKECGRSNEMWLLQDYLMFNYTATDTCGVYKMQMRFIRRLGANCSGREIIMAYLILSGPRNRTSAHFTRVYSEYL